MGFAKVAVMFILIAMFGMILVGMSAMAIKDKPTDSYYSNTSNTVTGSVGLMENMFSTSSSLTIPMIAVCGILLLMGGLITLRKV